MPEHPYRWRVLQTELLIDTPHLRLRRDRIQTPRGDIVDDYHVRESRGFAIIFALTAAGDVVVSRQYKYGIDAIVTELPGGAVDAGETPEAAAARELVEETGYEAPGGLEHIGSYVIDPTNTSGRYDVFLARDSMPTGKRHFDPTEEITTELIPLERMLDLVRNGTIDVGFHVAAIYAVLDRLGRLAS